MAAKAAILYVKKGTNLEILNFHVSLKPPTKFQLNPTYHSGEMFFQDFQDGHLGYWNWNRTNLAILNKSPPSWAAEQKDFRKFWISMSLWCGHLGYWNGTILAILNLYVATMPPTKFQLNPNYGSGQGSGNFKIWISPADDDDVINEPISKTRGPRATTRSPEWNRHCRYADGMQHFSNTLMTRQWLKQFLKYLAYKVKMLKFSKRYK